VVVLPVFVNRLFTESEEATSTQLRAQRDSSSQIIADAKR